MASSMLSNSAMVNLCVDKIMAQIAALPDDLYVEVLRDIAAELKDAADVREEEMTDSDAD